MLNHASNGSIIWYLRLDVRKIMMITVLLSAIKSETMKLLDNAARARP